jgi:hypothetical protein
LAHELDEPAKAVRELAKLGRDAISSTEKAGRYLSKYFSGGIEHLGGAFSDWAAGFRVRNLVNVMEKTDKRLAEAGFGSNFRQISDRNALPLIEAISLEPDEGIQEIWARLLANSARPDRIISHSSRVMINVLKNLEPEDVRVINVFLSKGITEERKEAIKLNETDFDPFQFDDILPSLARLSALGILINDSANGSLWAPQNAMALQVEIDSNFGSFRPTSLMVELEQAIAE